MMNTLLTRSQKSVVRQVRFEKLFGTNKFFSVGIVAHLEKGGLAQVEVNIRILFLFVNNRTQKF